jgi:hypothetical protein
MSLPLSPNTTCDIYQTGVAPPADPSVAAVPCHLQPDWRGGQERGDRAADALTWTHVMLVDVSVDIRDAYTGHSAHTYQDTVYIPDKDGTAFIVVFIERVQRGGAYDHKRVYLDRSSPNWPTNEL